ncbi:universal stress protein [Flagellimonas sp.]|uniref:universal stress protein n=1 Tax=Flagellimonas sp. TaxID=2058762 RepID=UPI003F4A341B
MKKILLPTDFSKNALNAILYALELFKNEKCLFYILNTYTPNFYRLDYLIGGPAVSTIPDKGVDASLEGLEWTLNHITEKYINPLHQYETVSAFSTLTDQVDEICKKEDIDMIIMGTQGASGAKEFFLGSNTVHVIRKSHTPVLAIPENYPFKAINNILFPTGYDRKYKSEDLHLIKELTIKWDATIHLVHATEEDEKSTDQLQKKEHLADFFKGRKVRFEDITEQYKPNVVHTYVDNNEIDLIVLMNKKHAFLERLLVKQNVDAIGYSSNVPFLVIKDTSENI